MKRVILSAVAGMFLIAAAPPLFDSSTESRWEIRSSDRSIATVVMLTDGDRVRVEWKSQPARPATVFIGAAGATWVRQAGGDVPLSTWTGPEAAVAPALLLPHQLDPANKVTTDKERLSSYSFANSVASYGYDDEGVSEIAVTTVAGVFRIRRTSIGVPRLQDASLYSVRPKSEVAGRMASLSGNLFSDENKQVSATAGARGVGKGTRFRDGGNYDALFALEARDEAWSTDQKAALDEFQKEGAVGVAQGDPE